MLPGAARVNPDFGEPPLYGEAVAPARASLPVHWPSSLPHARFEQDQDAVALRTRNVDTFGQRSPRYSTSAVQDGGGAAWASGT